MKMAAIHQAVYRALRADSTLAALLAVDVYEGSPTAAAIYDHVDQVEASEDPANFPYVVIGDDTGVPFDTDDLNGQEVTITIHIWDRYRGRKRAKQVADAIYSVLHTDPGEQPIQVDGTNCIFCYWDFGESIPDPDPMTKHEVTRFRIVTQG